MTSPIEPRTQTKLYHAPPQIAGAVWITVGGILMIYALQLGSGGLLGALGAAAFGFVMVAFVIRGAARIGGFSLGIRRAAPRFFIAAVLIGLACWYLEIQLVLHVRPPGDTAPIARVVEQTPLGLSLIVLALLPAIGEELLFRGVLARSLARWPVVAVVGSAVLFSAYHLVPAQMLGTFPLGLALGLLAVRSGSIVPGMIAHFLNNATVLVVERLDVSTIDRHPNLVFIGAAVLVAGGVALAVPAGVA